MEVTNRYLRTRDAATYCGLSHRTLEKLRLQDRGPRFIRLSEHRFVLYERTDLDAWLSTGLTNPEEAIDREQP